MYKTKKFLLFFLFSTAFLSAEKTEFIIVRHGETDWNIEQRYAGWTDVPLNSKGKIQSEKLAAYLKNTHPDLKALYSSDLSRACQTAEPTSKSFNLPVVKQFELREINWGDGEGLTPQEKEEHYGDEIRAVEKSTPNRKVRWDIPFFPNAETYNQLFQRIQKQLIEIGNAHPNQKVAVFTHGRLIKTLLSECLNSEETPYPHNCGVVHILYDSENAQSPLQFIKIENQFN